MTFKTAKEHFTKALTIAEQENDPFREAIATGLIELAAAMQLRTTQMKSELGTIKNKVS